MPTPAATGIAFGQSLLRLVVSAKRAGTTATWNQINKYFVLMQIPIVSSMYWNIIHGAIPEEVKKYLEGMQTMRILGNNMAYFLKCIKLGEENSLPKPIQEKVTFTNFIREQKRAERLKFPLFLNL